MTEKQPIFDPLSVAFTDDPYRVYASLRQLEHPFYYADADTWMLTKMADVEAVALDKTMLRSLNDSMSRTEIKAQQKAMNWHDMPYHERFVQMNLLESEGDVHARLRKLVFRAFTPAIIAKQRDSIQAFVDRLVDEFSDLKEIDFVADFAVHIPGMIIGRVLGIPDEDCPQLRIWSENVVKFYNVGCTHDDKLLAELSTKEFYDYLLGVLEARKKAPQEDLLTQLLQHEIDGAMSHDELIATAMLILMAGHGSTIDVLGSGMHALLRFPDEHAKLRADPTLAASAVQEMFRFESPLPYFHRFATTDCFVGGKSFSAGTRFGLLYGAANRDPARFVTPDVFDITRSPNRHMAFGGGAHFCLGNHLARLVMDITFTTINKRFQKVELIGPAPKYKRGLSVRGPQSLNISWRRT